MNENYWQTFYESHQISFPSRFAKTVARFFEGEVSAIEFGCGTGRDAVWLSEKRGWRVAATDRVSEGWKASELAGVPRFESRLLEFATLDLAQKSDVINTVRRFGERVGETEKAVFYSRFLLHSISSEEERILLSAIHSYRLPDSYICFEYRTMEDEPLQKTYTSHQRRYIDHDNLLVRLASMDYTILFHAKGQGLAPYKKEDPFVGRVIARRNPG